MIVFVGPDLNIYTMDQAGGNRVALTTDAVLSGEGERMNYYQFPTWSPDSQKLAFVGISGPGGDFERVSVYTVNSDGSSLTEVSSNDQELPYYLFWSPDSLYLSFLSQNATRSGGVLKLVSADGGDVQVIDTGYPYYWDWSPDGKRMVVHAGGGTGRLSFLTLGSQINEEGLTFKPSFFQAPAWSPKGDKLLLAIENVDGGGELILADRMGRYLETLTTFDGSVAFEWSPDGAKVAYILAENQSQVGALGKLTVVDLSNPEETYSSEEDLVLAFFWSPDSEKVAYFVPVLSAPETDAEGETREPQILQQVRVIDVNQVETWLVATFLPTEEFLRRLPFFDQYHHSVTIWSPDSKSMVLSGLATNGEPTIWVVAASGNLAPRLLTEGVLAYWSWQ